jgi:hypothetical protein
MLGMSSYRLAALAIGSNGAAVLESDMLCVRVFAGWQQAEVTAEQLCM